MSLTNEIASQANGVNKHLLALKLQKPKEGEPPSADKKLKGYSTGIHVEMDPRTGLLNSGKIEHERDLQPLVEDMKQKWRGKATDLN